MMIGVHSGITVGAPLGLNGVRIGRAMRVEFE
jgi:hypothetical protein